MLGFADRPITTLCTGTKLAGDDGFEPPLPRSERGALGRAKLIPYDLMLCGSLCCCSSSPTRIAILIPAFSVAPIVV